MSKETYDLVVIGTGPGGYVAAIRAAQLGMKVATVENDGLGGVCLNWGCIPTKSLIRNAEVYNLLKNAAEYGITCDSPVIDFPKVINRSRKVSQRLSKGVSYLFKKNKVVSYFGTARFVSRNSVDIHAQDGSIKGNIQATNIIIATGASPRSIPGVVIDRKKVISSKDAMVLDTLPSSMLIIGGGPIGLEFAYIFNSFGTKVTVVEMMPSILPQCEQEITAILQKSLVKQGITILTSTRILSVDIKSSKLKTHLTSPTGSSTVESDVVLMAAGVQPNSDNLGLEEIGVEKNNGFVSVDQFGKTSVDNIYAVGDVVGGPMLAHKASAEGICTVDTISGKSRIPVDYMNVPACTYCQPQVASIGLTEEIARQQGMDCKVGKFPFRANGKALALNESEGMVKIIFNEETGELVGAHMVGPEVTELINELSLAMVLESTDEDIHLAIHAHPTVSETIAEAAMDAFGNAIHI